MPDLQLTFTWEEIPDLPHGTVMISGPIIPMRELVDIVMLTFVPIVDAEDRIVDIIPSHLLDQS